MPLMEPVAPTESFASTVQCCGCGRGSDSGAMEEMLEMWLHCAEEIMADAIEMSTNIEDATRFLQASMSYLRNRLLRLELLAMVVSVALGFGALVSGIFGMNLKSGIELS